MSVSLILITFCSRFLKKTGVQVSFCIVLFELSTFESIISVKKNRFENRCPDFVCISCNTRLDSTSILIQVFHRGAERCDVILKPQRFGHESGCYHLQTETGIFCISSEFSRSFRTVLYDTQNTAAKEFLTFY